MAHGPAMLAGRSVDGENATLPGLANAPRV